MSNRQESSKNSHQTKLTAAEIEQNNSLSLDSESIVNNDNSKMSEDNFSPSPSPSPSPSKEDNFSPSFASPFQKR
ncbi:hypothetical protein QT995_27430 [Microcoleus sp. S36b_A3]|uniref:hypothetical protein n=1 Tax=unclassified Microcoleus TaxID=2642155 RepID=UPI002FD07A62